MDVNDLSEEIGQKIIDETGPSIGQVLEAMTSDELDQFFDYLTDVADTVTDSDEQTIEDFEQQVPDEAEELFETARERLLESGDY